MKIYITANQKLFRQIQNIRARNPARPSDRGKLSYQAISAIWEDLLLGKPKKDAAIANNMAPQDVSKMLRGSIYLKASKEFLNGIKVELKE